MRLLKRLLARILWGMMRLFALNAACDIGPFPTTSQGKTVVFESRPAGVRVRWV